MPAVQTKTTSEPFTISRTFDAPRDTVFKAWTDPAIMAKWWGPKGAEIISSKMDFHPGGTYLYGMKTPDGTEMWGKFLYQEIKAPEKITLINNFSDPQGGITRHPFAPTWPLQLFSVFTFEAVGDKTKVTIEWSPYKATDEETKTFEEGRSSMQQGWTGTLDQFADYLAASN